MSTHAGAYDVVPLVERHRYMQLFRWTVAALVGVFAFVVPAALDAQPGMLAAGTAVYLTASLVASTVWRRLSGHALWLFGAMLIADGVFLAWLMFVTGATASPLRFLPLLHLIAVALLASYRTSLKLALWHSLLVLVVYYAQVADVLPARGLDLPGSELDRITVFITVFWLVAIATASFSAINERELRRRRFDLEALAVMATKLEVSADSLAVADALVDSTADTFGFARAALLGRPTDPLALFVTRGVDIPAEQMRPDESSVVHAVVAERQTRLVSRFDARSDSWLSSLFPDGRNFLVVPLSAEQRAIGVLIVEHTARAGSRIERRIVAMVERFASHGALALRNAWLLEQVQRIATTDGLTGIANRRTFDAALDKELSRADRTGDPVALVLMDIDHFKKLNDTYGHQAGDEVLQVVAKVLADASRDFDTVARYGGEEFAVILPRCGAEDALAVADRLRLAVAGAPTPVPVTNSAGVSVFGVHATDGASLLKAADDALYESKRAGRNQVTLASPTTADERETVSLP